MNRVIYQNLDKSISVLIPAQQVLDLVGLQAIAEKDVPQDLPYWLVMDTEIPSDRTERDQWVLDGSEGAPHGFGGISNEFTDEQLLDIYNGGAIQ